MYKYSYELETPNNYNIYLKENRVSQKLNEYVSNVTLTPDFLIDYKNLFKRIDIIDMLISGSNEQFLLKYSNFFSYEELDTIYEFISEKAENYYYTKELKEKINMNAKDLEIIIRDYIVYCNYLMTIYPQLKQFILETKNIMQNTLIEIKKKTEIKLPLSQNGILYTFPNAWYITPNGFLYNTGTGHQEGNLTYPFNYIIRQMLKKEQKIPNINLLDKIKEILERGYVTSDEFSNYSHLVYQLPTILTPEVERTFERLNNIRKMNYEEIEKINEDDWPHPERTYQKKIINLITGYLAAKTALFQSFSRLNNSTRKKEIINILESLYFDDILIRYSGFHKVSSIADKTITTSSLKSIELFQEYLNKGWTLDIIPGIVYDKLEDDLVEIDFNSYYIDKYLDNILSKFNGPGKILIRK